MSADIHSGLSSSNELAPNPLDGASFGQHGLSPEHEARVGQVREALIRREEGQYLDLLNDPEKFLELQKNIKNMIVDIFTIMAENDGVATDGEGREWLEHQVDTMLASLPDHRGEIEKNFRQQARSSWVKGENLMETLGGVLKQVTLDKEFEVPAEFEEEMKKAAAPLLGDVAWREELMVRMADLVTITEEGVGDLDEAYRTALREVFPTPEEFLAARDRASRNVSHFVETFAEILTRADVEKAARMVRLVSKHLTGILDTLGREAAERTIREVYGEKAH